MNDASEFVVWTENFDYGREVMSDVYDEKYAFPIHADVRHDVQAGMTLRDYFAASALQGVMSNSSTIEAQIRRSGAEKTLSMAAETCYRLADSMMKERAKDNGEKL